MLSVGIHCKSLSQLLFENLRYKTLRDLHCVRLFYVCTISSPPATPPPITHIHTLPQLNLCFLVNLPVPEASKSGFSTLLSLPLRRSFSLLPFIPPFNPRTDLSYSPFSLCASHHQHCYYSGSNHPHLLPGLL